MRGVTCSRQDDRDLEKCDGCRIPASESFFINCKKLRAKEQSGRWFEVSVLTAGSVAISRG